MTNKEPSVFRLIAIRPHEGCNSRYKKILTNECYILHNGYTYNDGKIIKTNDDRDNVPINFYNSINEINISISAIIGKNGDGKSSIIELLMRILNNFAYATGFTEMQSNLKPIKSLCAELFYEINNNIYSINCNNNIIIWEIPNGNKFEFNLNNTKEDNNRKLKNLNLGDHFFYTQISNYSLYAYNSKEYLEESDNGEWIDGIFHKNDGYQTPIVLHPMRTNGNIDINIENDLSRQRLISLLLENSFRKINEKQEAKAFKIKLSDFSKLDKITLLDFFINCDQSNNIDAYISSIPYNKSSLSNFKNTNTDLKDKINRAFTLLRSLYSISSTNKRIFNKYLQKSTLLYPVINRINYSTTLYLGRIEYLLKNINLSDYNLSEVDIRKQIQAVTKFLKQKPISIIDLDQFDVPDDADIHFNFTYLQRIITVSLCEEIWLNKIQKSSIGKNDNVTEKVIQYMVYKTLSIISKYANYKDLSLRIFATIDLIDGSEKIDDLKKAISEAIDRIWHDVNISKTHITVKIRQCLNFIHDHPYAKADYCNNEDKWIDISTFYDKVIKPSDDAKKNPYDYFFPAIFDIDVLLQHKDDIRDIAYDSLFLSNIEDCQTMSLLSQLSSGERQQINAVSSIIYHIRNIDSVAKDEPNLVKYQHINLIFEEIELYFHPEYQRTFLDFLVSQIKKTKLNLKSIHICFVTHSPFILSDIPQQSVLILKKGIPRRVAFNTLAANIHELLAKDFMLEYTIGEYTRNKINRFLEEYSAFKNDNYRGDVNLFITQNNINFLINNMGEGYLKTMLNHYYEEMNEVTPDELNKLITTKELELQLLKAKQKRPML